MPASLRKKKFQKIFNKIIGYDPEKAQIEKLKPTTVKNQRDYDYGNLNRVKELPNFWDENRTRI
jgi:hypothetical protein